MFILSPYQKIKKRLFEYTYQKTQQLKSINMNIKYYRSHKTQERSSSHKDRKSTDY